MIFQNGGDGKEKKRSLLLSGNEYLSSYQHKGNR